MQTAIIIRYRGEEVLVRLNGIHVPADQIDVDTRGRSWESWQPVEDDTVEVRLEGRPDHSESDRITANLIEPPTVTTATVDFDAWAQAEMGTTHGPESFAESNVGKALTADLFPTVEEVGAKTIAMYECDPAWWRYHFPLELASICEQWLDAHGRPVPTRLPAGTRVRLRTVNGGDTVCVLATEYLPTYGCDFYTVANDGTVTDHKFHRLGPDIVSVDVAP